MSIGKNLYIITGGPGVGKTTLLNELAKAGHKIVPEVARQIIKEQIANDGEGLPWKNKSLYIDLMLRASVDSYKSVLAENHSAICFFDRGILDAFCYSEMVGFGISTEMNQMEKICKYNRKAFILPPWLEIYHTDNERKQTWKEAVFTFQKMKETYLKYGYKTIEVPKDTIENRKNFMLENIVSV